MNQKLAETLLYVLVASNAALLLFIAGVLRRVMNDMDEAALRGFIGSLYRHSSRSPFMLAILNGPFLGALPYFYFFGFKNSWITSGLALWFATGCMAKVIKVPFYKEAAESAGSAERKVQRRRLYFGNTLQAILYSAATLLMTVAFTG